MDGSNTTFLLGRPIFRGYVSFREGKKIRSFLFGIWLFFISLGPFRGAPRSLQQNSGSSLMWAMAYTKKTAGVSQVRYMSICCLFVYMYVYMYIYISISVEKKLSQISRRNNFRKNKGGFSWGKTKQRIILLNDPWVERIPWSSVFVHRDPRCCYVHLLAPWRRMSCWSWNKLPNVLINTLPYSPPRPTVTGG